MKKETKNKRILKLFFRIAEWLVYMLSYTLVFIGMACMFDTFVVDEDHFILYSFTHLILFLII